MFPGAETAADDNFQYLFSGPGCQPERIANFEFPFVCKVEFKRWNNLVLLLLQWIE